MPIYEYRCSKGHQYELAEGFDAAAEHKCRSCGAKARRVISLPAVIFKGSGFYSTDNRSDSYRGNGGSSGLSSSEDKADAKKDSASEPKDSGKESKAEAATAE